MLSLSISEDNGYYAIRITTFLDAALCYQLIGGLHLPMPATTNGIRFTPQWETQINVTSARVSFEGSYQGGDSGACYRKINPTNTRFIKKLRVAVDEVNSTYFKQVRNGEPL